MALRPPVDLERLCLAARAVERDHQLPAQTFPIAVLIDQRLELPHDVRMTPEGKIRLDPRLDAAKPQILQSSDLRLSEWLVHDIGERRPAPQPQRPVQQVRRLRRCASSGGGCRP